MSIRFEEKHIPVTESGCWIWIGAKTGNGYGVIWVKGEYVASHRVSYEMFNGSIPARHLVCHTCDTPLCVNPDHLFIGSHADNMADRNRKLRQAHGERNFGSKLKNNDVLAIRNSSKDNKVLAAKYGVHFSTIYEIKTNKTWRNIWI